MDCPHTSFIWVKIISHILLRNFHRIDGSTAQEKKCWGWKVSSINAFWGRLTMVIIFQCDCISLSGIGGCTCSEKGFLQQLFEIKFIIHLKSSCTNTMAKHSNQYKITYKIKSAYLKRIVTIIGFYYTYVC